MAAETSRTIFEKFATEGSGDSRMTNEGEAFSDLADAIRQAAGVRTWKEFAARAGLSESLLSELRSGKKSLSAATAEHMGHRFPPYAQRLQSLSDNQRAQQSDVGASTLARLIRLQQTSRSQQALDGVNLLLQQPDLRRDVRGQALRLLATVALDTGDFVVAAESVRMALDEAGRSQRAAASDHADAVALRLTNAEQYELAESVPLHQLGLELSNGRAWRRLGCVRWYAGDLLEAYAGLTTALTFGHHRRHVLHARGQVLAELGQAPLAIADLTEVIPSSPSPTGQSYARSALGRAYFCAGQPELAEAEFRTCRQVTPNNAWLYFHIGNCCYDAGKFASARQNYQMSLERAAPPLNRAKRLHVKMRLGEIEDGEQ